MFKKKVLFLYQKYFNNGMYLKMSCFVKSTVYCFVQQDPVYYWHLVIHIVELHQLHARRGYC